MANEALPRVTYIVRAGIILYRDYEVMNLELLEKPGAVGHNIGFTRISDCFYDIQHDTQ